MWGMNGRLEELHEGVEGNQVVRRFHPQFRQNRPVIRTRPRKRPASKGGGKVKKFVKKGWPSWKAKKPATWSEISKSTKEPRRGKKAGKKKTSS